MIMTWQLSQTKRRHRRFLSKLRTVLYINCVFWANQARKDRFGIFWVEKERFLDQKSEVLIKVQIIKVFQRD